MGSEDKEGLEMPMSLHTSESRRGREACKEPGLCLVEDLNTSIPDWENPWRLTQKSWAVIQITQGFPGKRTQLMMKELSLLRMFQGQRVGLGGEAPVTYPLLVSTFSQNPIMLVFLVRTLESKSYF